MSRVPLRIDVFSDKRLVASGRNHISVPKNAAGSGIGSVLGRQPGNLATWAMGTMRNYNVININLVNNYDVIDGFGGKNEAAGAADARLCHTRSVWACRVRFIGNRRFVLNI